MTAPAITPDTIFRFTSGTQQVVAKPIATLICKGKNRVVLMDTAERHWVIALDDNCNIGKIITGPLTGAQALHEAESIVAGVADHGSVANLVNELALGVIILANKTQEEAAA